MDMARNLHRRTQAAPGAPEPAPETDAAAEPYARRSRAVRLTFSLKARMDQDLADLRAGKLDRVGESARDYSSADGARSAAGANFSRSIPAPGTRPTKSISCRKQKEPGAAGQQPIRCQKRPACCQNAARELPIAASRRPGSCRRTAKRGQPAAIPESPPPPCVSFSPPRPTVRPSDAACASSPTRAWTTAPMPPTLVRTRRNPPYLR